MKEEELKRIMDAMARVESGVDLIGLLLGLIALLIARKWACS